MNAPRKSNAGASKRVPTRRHKNQPGTPADGSYALLRERILTLELAPGTDLDEETLAQECGVSRTPLREALIRLAADHLVVLLPNRGYAVAPLRLTDLPQFIEALAVNQGAVNALAAERRSELDLQRIEGEARRFDELLPRDGTDAVTEQNYLFHLAIGDASHNEFFAAAYRHLLDESIRLARTCFTYDAHKREAAEEHWAMVDAIRRQDAAGAERLGREHAMAFQRRILAFLEGNAVDTIRAISAHSPPTARRATRVTRVKA